MFFGTVGELTLGIPESVIVESENEACLLMLLL